MSLYDVLIKIGGDTSKYEKSMNSVRLYTKKTTQLINGYWIAAAAGFYTALKGYEELKSAAKAEQEAAAFKNLAATYGKNANEIIAQLKRVSNETLDTATIINKAGTAMMMGIDPDTIVKLMEIARATARQTGQSVSDAFADISLAVGRQSKMILDNLGIIVSVEKANEAYAKSLGKTSSQLTDAEKKQAFLNATIQAGDELVNRIGATGTTSAESIQQFEAAISDLKTELETALLPTLAAIASATAEAIGGFRIFFGIGEEAKLQKQLMGVLEDLDEVDAKLAEMEGKKRGEGKTWFDDFVGNINYDPQVIQKHIDELEAEKAALEAKHNQIRAQILQGLYAAPAGAGVRTGMAGATTTIAGASAEAEFDQAAVEKIIQDQLEAEREAYDKVLELQNEFLQDYLSKQKAAKEEQEALEEDLNDRIMELTLDAKDYKIYTLNKEVAAMRETAGENEEILAQIDAYYDASMQRISEKTEKTFGEEMRNAVSGWASSMSSDLADLVMDADASFSDMLRAYEKMLLQMVIQKNAVEPMLEWGSDAQNWKNAFTWIGSMFTGGGGAAASAKGNVFSGPGIAAYENHIVGRPTLFPFARGVGLMGESGYEGILPLTRTRSGDLGVKAEGGGTVIENHWHITGNQVWDQASMQRLMTNIASMVTERQAPGAVVRNYRRDGIARSGLRR